MNNTLITIIILLSIANAVTVYYLTKLQKEINILQMIVANNSEALKAQLRTNESIANILQNTVSLTKEIVNTAASVSIRKTKRNITKIKD